MSSPNRRWMRLWGEQALLPPPFAVGLPSAAAIAAAAAAGEAPGAGRRTLRGSCGSAAFSAAPPRSARWMALNISPNTCTRA
jgi:hypothetical protein